MLAGLKFCERCRASIPEAEFDDGRALRVGSKHVHVDCLLKRSAWVGVVALILALYAAGMTTWILTQKERKGATEATAAVPADPDAARRAEATAQSAAKSAAAAEA